MHVVLVAAAARAGPRPSPRRRPGAAPGAVTPPARQRDERDRPAADHRGRRPGAERRDVVGVDDPLGRGSARPPRPGTSRRARSAPARRGSRRPPLPPARVRLRAVAAAARIAARPPRPRVRRPRRRRASAGATPSDHSASAIRPNSANGSIQPAWSPRSDVEQAQRPRRPAERDRLARPAVGQDAGRGLAWARARRRAGAGRAAAAGAAAAPARARPPCAAAARCARARSASRSMCASEPCLTRIGMCPGRRPVLRRARGRCSRTSGRARCCSVELPTNGRCEAGVSSTTAIHDERHDEHHHARRRAAARRGARSSPGAHTR